MRIACILDPLPKLKAYKDSSIAMLREAARRGHTVYAIMRDDLLASGAAIRARATRLELFADNDAWYAERESAEFRLAEFDAVLMRQDPPFDFEYITATWLLERAVAQGARIFNDPRALRDHSEKVSILEFPDLIPPTLVARSADALNAFVDEYADCVLKPLDGMGGARIFRVRADDPNRNVIVETLTDSGAETIMAQRFLPEIALGDKRISIIDGEPVPYSLARIPKAGETRGNLAAGGRGVAQLLSARDREIANALGPQLASRGLLLVGIDVIGDYLTEINVTSPTCFVEIADQTGFDVAARFIDALEARLAA
ncbi:MAG: glutathione synthase [Rhodocyclaceae bacterium]|nr:glutathione synthase [Rhodocyclaceae bacterium]MBX3670816.1 glutathione synthase [Rhodocyclaceae bacterium]